jgi:hypothetical protein
MQVFNIKTHNINDKTIDDDLMLIYTHPVASLVQKSDWPTHLTRGSINNEVGLLGTIRERDGGPSKRQEDSPTIPAPQCAIIQG